VTEASLNRTLRRVDWRFLPHLEDEPRTACFAEGRLQADVQRVLGTAPEPPWDLAVVVDPSERTLREAHAGLRQGGAVYAEWRRPTPAARVRARLEAADFIHVEIYWPWPWHRGLPRFWYPLGSARAAGAILRRRRPGTARLDRLQRAAVAAAKLGVLPPLAAVAAKPPATALQPLVLLTGGSHSLNKAVGVDPNDGHVIKFARTAEQDGALVHEHTVLSLLEQEHPDLGGVPRPLALGRRCGRVAVAESPVFGRPLVVDAATAEQVTDWLVALAGHAPPRPRSTWWERLVAEPLRAFERDFGAVVDRTELHRAQTLLERVPDLPLVVEHRDVAPWNLVAAEAGGIGVLDWESSEPEGLPLLDLVYFLEQAGVELHVRERCIERYCAALSLPLETVTPLRALCWIVHARSERRRLEVSQLAGSSFVRLLRAELAQAP